MRESHYFTTFLFRGSMPGDFSDQEIKHTTRGQQLGPAQNQHPFCRLGESDKQMGETGPNPAEYRRSQRSGLNNTELRNDDQSFCHSGSEPCPPGGSTMLDVGAAYNHLQRSSTVSHVPKKGPPRPAPTVRLQDRIRSLQTTATNTSSALPWTRQQPAAGGREQKLRKTSSSPCLFVKETALRLYSSSLAGKKAPLKLFKSSNSHLETKLEQVDL